MMDEDKRDMNSLGDMEIEIKIDPAALERFHKSMGKLRSSLVEGIENAALAFYQHWANGLDAANASRDTVVNVSYMNKHGDWFEVKAFADPTHVEMRKLSGEEAEQAQQEYEKQQAEEIATLLRYSYPEWFETETAGLDFTAISDSLALPDRMVLKHDKAAARERSKADVKKKRKDVMRRKKL